MKAHFIGSTANLEADINSYQLIVAALKDNEVSLTSDWLEKAYKRISTKNSTVAIESSWQDIYRENIEAISKADIVVAEVGEKSFLVGFQVANALHMKKPTLLLSKFEKADSALGVSLNEEIIKYVKYTDNTVADIVEQFIKENGKDGKDIRFNFFISRKLLNYLNWAVLKTGEKKSEMIRRLIEKDMNESNYR